MRVRMLHGRKLVHQIKIRHDGEYWSVCDQYGLFVAIAITGRWRNAEAVPNDTPLTCKRCLRTEAKGAKPLSQRISELKTKLESSRAHTVLLQNGLTVYKQTLNTMWNAGSVCESFPTARRATIRQFPNDRL